jgi:heptosyltransferase-1
MTTPAITALRKGLPSAHISYVVETPFRELIEGNPHIDETIVLPRPLGTKNFLKTVYAFRKESLDIAIDFHGGPTASLLTFLSGAKQKVGYRIKYKSHFYDIALPRGQESGYVHSVEKHIHLVKALGIAVPSSPPLLLPESSDAEKNKIQLILTKNRWEKSKVIVIHVGAGNTFREWGDHHWTKLAAHLVTEQKAKIVLIGTPEDQTIAGKIQSKHPKSIFSLAGELTLKELKELIAKASLFVGPDSGPMHIAASTPTPIVALFGPNLSAYNAPWQANAAIIEKDLDCRPCDQRHCITGDFRCMRTIQPAEVFEACLPFLNRS